MNKICTSIEQSKELIEIGLDPETADMCWISKFYTGGAEFWEDPEVRDGALDSTDVPAWSSSALLGIIDSAPELKEFSLFKENGRWYCNLYGEKEVYQAMGYYKENGDYHYKENGDYFDAIIEAIRVLYIVIRKPKNK